MQGLSNVVEGRDNTQDKYITKTFICSHVKNEVDPMIQSPVASPLAATVRSNSFLWDFVVSRVTVEGMLHRATAFHCIEVCCLRVVSGGSNSTSDTSYCQHGGKLVWAKL